MCTRFLIISNIEAIKRMFRAEGPSWNLRPRYNVTPTSQVIIVRNATSGARRELASVRWDFVASWLKELGKRRPIVNARAEGIEAAPMFRAAIRRRRALMVADGFYEWKDLEDGTKQPWCIRMADESTFAFGAIWDTWLAPTGDEIESAALITTSPNAKMEPIHNRMPVILPPDQYDMWLDEKTALPEALAMLKPCDPDLLNAYEVGKAIGNVKADGEELMKPVPRELPTLL